MSGAIDVVVVQVTPEMIHNWGWFLAFGIVLLLLGVAAVVRSVAATVASMVFFGWLLVFAGLIEFVDAFTFDFTMPVTHSFVVNGIITHNSNCPL
jgi:uncharacterized membrane protein HdeD (DUF308 family)